MIQDVKTLCGPNCDSDHFLVKVIVKQKLISTHQKLAERLRYNSNKTQETQNVEQDWQNIKTAILEAAKETIQTQPRIIYNEWWDEKCKEAIKEKNIARKKCLQRRTRATQEEHKKEKTYGNQDLQKKEETLAEKQNKSNRKNSQKK